MIQPTNRLKTLAALVLALAGHAALADTLQGVVKDELGNPAAGVLVAPTGAASGAQPTATTDAVGAWQATVPADLYTLVFTPPAGSGLVPLRETGVAVSGVTSIGARFLRFGVDVTGLVTDPDGLPVTGVDLRFFDLASRETIYTPGDDTDLTGQFSVFVPPSTYEVEFRPPELVSLAPLELAPVDVTAAGSLGTFVLPAGVVVIGTVLDDQGGPVDGCDLDFIDTATGSKIFTTRDDTNVFGVYRTVVVPGTYDIRYLPPPQTGLLAKETPGVVLTADVTLPDVTLTTGLQFSGRVVNAAGTGLADVDLNVFDASTGQQLLTPGDNTDADGYYLLPLEGGVYDVRYTPPAGPPYLPRKIDGIIVDDNVVHPDVVLELGYLVSGTTVDETLQAVADVDLDFKDVFINSFIYVARDDTGAAGDFAVAVPGSTYRVDLVPPPSTNLLPLSLEDLVVDRDIDLGQLVLASRRRVSGTVQNGSETPLSDVGVTIVDEASGSPVPGGGPTDATGSFEVLVPDGTYRLRLEPAPGTPYFALETDPFHVDGDLDLGVQVLETGFHVEGVVVDQAGAAIAGVTVRLIRSGSGSSEYVAQTDDGGRFDVLVPAADYEVVYDPSGLPFLRLEAGPFSIAADTMLPRAVLPPGYTVSGQAVDDTMSGVGSVDVDLLDEASGASIPLQGDLTASDGTFGVKVGEGTYRLRLQPDPGTGLFDIVTGAFDVGADFDLGTLFLPRGLQIGGNVVDGEGTPVPDVEVEFMPLAGNLFPDTIKVVTNFSGGFATVVPQGWYDVRFDPLPASSLLTEVVGPLELSTDTTLPTVVLTRGWHLTGSVVDPLLVGVAGVDLDLIDPTTGASLPLQGDLTGPTGAFGLLAAPGTYLLRLEPDPGTRLLPHVTGPLNLHADLDVGTLMLEAGVLLSGAVVDGSADGVADVTIDVVDTVSGIDQLLVGDRTDAAGEFTTAVTTGSYHVEYRPPAGTAYVAQRTGPFAVSADTVLPVVVLEMGTLVSGVVLGPDGSPLGDVETEWRFAGTCDVAFTVRDATDTGGRYEVALLPGSYDVTLIPPPGSGLVPEKLFSIAVAGPEAVVPTHQLSLVAPEVERCNQLDDDCDGMVDEAFPDLGGACSVGVGACASAGVLVCAPDGTQSLCDAAPGSPSDEVCDGIDNDCDGVTDEGCSTVDVALHVTRPALSWGAVDGAIGYDVIRGDLDLLRGSGYATAVLECVADGTTMTTLDDSGSPPSEQGWWFLVRVETASGPESYGSAARDTGIEASPQACPP